MQALATSGVLVACALVTWATAPAVATAQTPEKAPIDLGLRTSTPSIPAARAASEYRLLGAGVTWVRVRSTAYTAGQVQPLVDVLARLPHGPEFEAVTLFVATPGQRDRICGVAAMGCYDPYRNEIYVSGDPEPIASVPPAFVLAHEYGHHIANHRGNAPWNALEWGPKRWATRVGVCAKTRQGRLHPGNHDVRYWSNPGEGFAQAYAHLAMPEVDLPWFYDPQLAPDPGTLAALRLDVLRPLSGPRRRHWKLSLRRPSPGLVIPLSTRFDGRLRVAVSERHRRDARLELLDPRSGKMLARSRDAGRREILRYDVCSRRSLRLRVRASDGAGRLVVRVLSH